VRALALAALLLLLTALAAPASAGTAPSVRLSFRVDDGEGTVRSAKLRCSGGSAAATGYLKRAPARHCRRVRKLTTFLATRPPRDRVCTQVYGGPETARVEGRIGDRAVHRSFDRADGCGSADWDRMGSLLG
jgi:hypothetical protein